MTASLPMGRYGRAALCAALLTACAAPAAPPAPTPVTATPTPPAPDIEAAFSLPDPFSRRTRVLEAVDVFLRTRAREMDDAAASAALTRAAFDSQRITLADPGFVRRQGDLAVVGLPDGLGLYWYDLSSAAPLLISEWTIGLSAVEVAWQPDAAGVTFTTLGNEGLLTAHYALMVRRDNRWHIAWLSDDQPDWWLNAAQAQVTVTPDLSGVTVIGPARDTTLSFAEGPGHPARLFRMEWQRTADSYTPSLPGSAFNSRQEWAWAAAEPSPYTTLVEFIERLQRNDRAGAGRLAANIGVVPAASSFGLYLIDRPYEVILYEQDVIVFRGRQGTFAARFIPPGEGSRHWLITTIEPTGTLAETVTP